MLRIGTACQCIAFILLLALAGCDGENSSPDQSDAGEVAAASGYARGRVTMPDGSPIETPDAKVTLFLQGVNEETAESIQLSPQIDADGHYEQKLVPGHYHYSDAMIEVPYEGESFRLDLDPVEDMRAQRPSSEGLVQNFVWRISGQRPNTAGDPEQAAHWYGGQVVFQYAIYREDLRQAMPLPEPGTRFLFQLTPLGPLIDGSTGEPLAFEGEWTADMSVTSTLTLHDVPIGSYELTGEIVHLDGTTRPAVFVSGPNQYAPQVELHFTPNRLGNTAETIRQSVGEQLE